MTARTSMAALISRVRLLINDSDPGDCQNFTDNEIQDVLDAGRQDVMNGLLTPKPTFSGSTIQYLDYFAILGDWETDAIFKQYLTTTVTPTTSEPIVGRWTFATNTLPPIYITGKTYDVYRSAADLLDRMAAKWAMAYNFSVDGQSRQRGQVTIALQNLARTYRMQQRPGTINAIRTDLNSQSQPSLGLGPNAIDYMASGNGGG